MPTSTRFDNGRALRVQTADRVFDIIRQGPIPSYHSAVWQPFTDKHAQLGGAPGAPMAPDGFPEQAGSGRRVRYQNGAIYERRDGGTAWVYGMIGHRYDELGGPVGWLGMPLTDESDLPEGGRISVFEHGAIYWWPDVGAIDLNDVVVHYTGLLCFGETDSDGDDTPFEDEPYVILGVVAPTGSAEVRSQIYGDVDAGDVRQDNIELYRGRPSGLVIGVQLMEHDFGDPDKFKEHVRKFVEKASVAVEKGLEYVPVVGPVLSDIAEAVLPYLKEPITDFLNSTLGTDDDDLGQTVLTLSVKQMVVLAARTPNSDHYGVGFKAQTELLGSEQGATYKACFGLVAV